MKLNIDLPDDIVITRLDFGYVEAFSMPYSCWMQVDSKMYRGKGNSLQEAFTDMMVHSFTRGKPVFEQRKQLAKQDIKDIF